MFRQKDSVNVVPVGHFQILSRFKMAAYSDNNCIESGTLFSNILT